MRGRLWMAEMLASSLEVACRGPDIDEMLRFWTEEIARALPAERIGLYLLQSDRWLHIRPDHAGGESPLISDSLLRSALSSAEPLKIERTLLARYSARESWKGVLALHKPRGWLGPRRVGCAQRLAGAIATSLSALQRSEIACERALALERSRWANELHDGHLQSLSSAKLQAEVCLSLRRRQTEELRALALSGDTALDEELPRLHQFLTETVREARQYLLELRSPPVSAEQFLPWLRAYADDFTRQTGVQVDIRLEGEGKVPQFQLEETTRLVREALINVRKHAKAGMVRVELVFSEQLISLSVSDDGIGFDVKSTFERILDSSRHGLIGLRYRAESLGGEMRLMSEPGKGTTLLFRLPRSRSGPRSSGERRRPGVAFLPTRPKISAAAPTTVRESIRETLADTLGSYLEQEGPLPRDPDRSR